MSQVLGNNVLSLQSLRFGLTVVGSSTGNLFGGGGGGAGDSVPDVLTPGFLSGLSGFPPSIRSNISKRQLDQDRAWTCMQTR